MLPPPNESSGDDMLFRMISAMIFVIGGHFVLRAVIGWVATCPYEKQTVPVSPSREKRPVSTSEKLPTPNDDKEIYTLRKTSWNHYLIRSYRLLKRDRRSTKKY